MADAAEATEEVEVKPKKPIVKIILAVLALVLLVAGTMVGTLFITGFFNKPAPTPEDMIAQGEGDQGEKKGDGSSGAPASADAKGDGKNPNGPPKLNKKSPDSPRFDYTYHQLDREFLVNLSGSRKVMSVQIAIMTRYDERVIENLKKHEFALRSGVMDVMRQTMETDLPKPDFRKDLGVKIRDAMNSLLEKYEDFGGVEEVMFTSFIVQ